jgi:hypothetical protein
MPQSSREMYDAIVKLRSLLEREGRQQTAAASEAKPIEALPSSTLTHTPAQLPSPPPTMLAGTPQTGSPPPATSTPGTQQQAAPEPRTIPAQPAAAEPAQPTLVENACRSGWPEHVTVRAPAAPVFIQPRVLSVPLVSLTTGTALTPTQRTGDWFLIKFEDRRWGPRTGYIHCADVTVTR